GISSDGRCSRDLHAGVLGNGKLHHNSIRFKMDTKKSVLDLEAFREMLHISPRIPSQSFAELPSKEEILDFLRFLGHSHEIRYLTDVNVNKLYQPWRSFASVINKFLTGKSSGIDSFRLFQAQILWGFYHRINLDYAYLIWEDFVYQESARKKKGDSASSTTPPIPTPTTTVVSAPRLFATAKESGKGGDEVNESEGESDEEETRQEEDESFDLIPKTPEGNDDDDDNEDNDDNDEEEELAKSDEEEESGKGGDEVRESEGESDEEQEEEESFDQIPRTPEESEEESNDEEEQDLRLSEEARIQEEEDADELYLQIQTDRLQDSLQRENDEFLRNINENIKKILKGLVKNQVKKQVSRILPRIEESVNATLKAKVQTRSSQSSRTSYAIAADLSEMELKKILIEKMEGNKSIQRSDEQRNLYKALVEAYEADKAILDSYGDSTILKLHLKRQPRVQANLP
nr:hypothetical protein [Tanacetum cinerariifolium]